MFIVKDENGRIVRVIVFGVVYTAPEDPAELPDFMATMQEILKEGNGR